MSAREDNSLITFEYKTYHSYVDLSKLLSYVDNLPKYIEELNKDFVKHVRNDIETLCNAFSCTVPEQDKYIPISTLFYLKLPILGLIAMDIAEVLNPGEERFVPHLDNINSFLCEEEKMKTNRQLVFYNMEFLFRYVFDKINELVKERLHRITKEDFSCKEFREYENERLHDITREPFSYKELKNGDRILATDKRVDLPILGIRYREEQCAPMAYTIAIMSYTFGFKQSVRDMWRKILTEKDYLKELEDTCPKKDLVTYPSSYQYQKNLLEFLYYTYVETKQTSHIEAFYKCIKYVSYLKHMERIKSIDYDELRYRFELDDKSDSIQSRYDLYRNLEIKVNSRANITNIKQFLQQ